VSTPSRSLPLDVASLRRAYRSEAISPAEVVSSVFAAIAHEPTEGIWIQLADPEEAVAEARAVERSHDAGARPPLYGLPFAVKDNIDVRGLPTTAACPDFAYLARESAPVVDRLRAAGAIFIGKTNLDQLATGLVGVRSPYGIPTNPFDARYVTGGSSSGSAAAVARGQVSFALATDTAGSGRVPAAFTNIVGLKPSRGLLSTRGLVPACRSIDCMSILALTCDDARDVIEVATGFDAEDPYSRAEAASFSWRVRPLEAGLHVGAPRREDRSFDDECTRDEFDRSCARLEAMGVRVEPVDMTPFFEAGRLLYEGAWLAERLSGMQEFVRAHPESVLPVIRTILARAEPYAATDAFRALHRLKALGRAVEPIWSRVHALVVPTAPELPKIDEVLADPVEANARLGRYTTFANLLDLSAVAVPSGLRRDGLPSGVTFVGPWGRDPLLLALASAFHSTVKGPLGATAWPWPVRDAAASPGPPPAASLPLAVVGAHLSGQPLNHQLTERGASLLRTARTARGYRLYALPGTDPPKPGLVRVDASSAADRGGPAEIEVEVWAMPLESLGSFLASVRSPLAIGEIDLNDGTRVHGFLCEGHAVSGASDISAFGGWRAYLADQRQSSRV
jgi:allophanate hydrolase